MKRKQKPVDPTNALLASVGISKNAKSNKYEVAPPHDLQVTQEEDLDFPRTSPPHFFPCIVLRLSPGAYCYFPVYVSAVKSRNEGNEPNIWGKYRELVVPEDLLQNREFINRAMLKMTRMESYYHKCEACLCLGPDLALYYRPKSDSFDKQSSVPENSHWLSDREYKEICLFDKNDNGEMVERDMKKSLSRQMLISDAAL